MRMEANDPLSMPNIVPSGMVGRMLDINYLNFGPHLLVVSYFHFKFVQLTLPIWTTGT